MKRAGSYKNTQRQNNKRNCFSELNKYYKYYNHAENIKVITTLTEKITIGLTIICHVETMGLF